MAVPVHQLAAPQDFLAILDGFPQRSAPGAIVRVQQRRLRPALDRRRARDRPELLRPRPGACPRAGRACVRRRSSAPTDSRPGAALGYLEDGRTNVLHLPVRGVGDGGAYTTVRDLESFWQALFAGRIVPLRARRADDRARNDRSRRRTAATASGSGSPRSDRRSSSRAWTPASRAGPPSIRRRASPTPCVSNTSSGVWPLAERLDGTSRHARGRLTPADASGQEASVIARSGRSRNGGRWAGMFENGRTSGCSSIPRASRHEPPASLDARPTPQGRRPRTAPGARRRPARCRPRCSS